MEYNPPRRQRKRVSALHLSSDTAASLPDYRQSALLHDVPSDRPPDYPDSAEEADEETEPDIDDPYHSPSKPRHPLHSASPRSQRRFLQPPAARATTHKRRHSSTAVLKSRTDTYLDTLLERSVHALEMSNTLLESSISTQATMSAFLSSEHHSGNAESALEARAIGLSSTLLRSWDAQENWAEQLDRIKQGVDSLCDEEPTEPATRSMPSSSPLRDLSSSIHRKPSGDQLHQLRYQDRTCPPRAPTLYIDANPISSTPLVDGADSDTLSELILPSSLGTVGSTHATSAASSSTSNLLLPLQKSALEPQLTSTHVDPSTPAYNMLSNLAARSNAANLNASSSTLTIPLPPSAKQYKTSTASAPSSFVSSFLSNMSPLRRRNSSPPPSPNDRSSPRRTSRSTSAAPLLRHSPMKKRRSTSADQHSIASSRSSRSWRGDDSPVTVVVRQMTPPTEGTDEDAEVSSSSDGCIAKRTVVSLRKILDDQPPPPLTTAENNIDNASVNTMRPFKAPAFMPRTPAVTPSAGTSTATASISRLFTKGVHSSSTRARSPPPRSVMKRRGVVGSEPVSPSPSISSFGGVASGSSLGAPAGGSAQTISGNAFGITGFGTLVSRALLSSRSTSSVSSMSNDGESTPSSGVSTPKRISFATLPESYASTKPEGEAGSVERRKRRSSRKRSSSASGMQRSDEYNEREGGHGGGGEGNANWWTSWLGGADVVGAAGGGGGREKERVEDRMTRRMGMGMSMHSSGGVMDEWGV